MHFIRELTLLEMDLVTGGDRTVPPRKRFRRPARSPTPGDPPAAQAEEAARGVEGEPRVPPSRERD